MGETFDNSNKPNKSLEIDKLLLDHDYDGIQELDHPLPRWWLATLYATIVFSIFYMGYYLTGIGPTLTEELQVDMQEIESKKKLSPVSEQNNSYLYVLLKDPVKVGQGLAVYTGKCAPCHGDKGQGVIGPNLTDDFWIHGTGNLDDIAKVIRIGIPEKGMPPWQAILTPDEVQNVVAFIGSVHGTNPANAKEPQGEKQEWKTQ